MKLQMKKNEVANEKNEVANEKNEVANEKKKTIMEMIMKMKKHEKK